MQQTAQYTDELGDIPASDGDSGDEGVGDSGDREVDAGYFECTSSVWVNLSQLACSEKRGAVSNGLRRLAAFRTQARRGGFKPQDVSLW